MGLLRILFDRTKRNLLLEQDVQDAISRLNRLEIQRADDRERHDALAERVERLSGRLGAPKKPAALTPVPTPAPVGATMHNFPGG